MAGTNSFILDSYALIGYLEGESFSNRIEEILRRAGKGEFRIYLHVIHLGEVYYITLREKGKDAADLAFSRIKSFPVVFVDKIDNDLLITAATFKAFHPVSYADAFAAALAKINNSSLLTGDPEFRSLQEKALIEIEWLNHN